MDLFRSLKDLGHCIDWYMILESLFHHLKRVLLRKDMLCIEGENMICFMNHVVIILFPLLGLSRVPKTILCHQI